MFGAPNFLAYLALILWGPVTLVIFHRFRGPTALIISVLAGTMFLPEVFGIDLPALPPFDKESITLLWAFVGCTWKCWDRVRQGRPLLGIDAFFLVVLIGNVGTSLTNEDALQVGPSFRPALTLYDAFAFGVKDILTIYLAFFLGRAVLRDSRDLEDLSRLLVFAGLVYSALCLVEIRMSPQLNLWTYGYYQMDFLMTWRFGGYRPMIYMATGMAVSMFMLVTAIMATARWRIGLDRKPYRALWLTAIVGICKSTGTWLYAIIFLPMIALTKKKPRGYIPAALGLLVLSYPALRAADYVPTDKLVEYAEMFNEERGLSLWCRFDQEGQLLERARERFWFGWGGYERNLIYDEYSGDNISVTDGDWVINIGVRGIVGFLGLYSLMTFPLMLSVFRVRRLWLRQDRILYNALAVSAAVLIADLVPNGYFNCLPMFLAGALHGIGSGILQRQEAELRRLRALRRQARRLARGAPTEDDGRIKTAIDERLSNPE
ncbi:MAG: hypothetical protein ACFCGT_26025 [Sandaracinaceae bacterium]